MRVDEEPASDKVTTCTGAFEEIDAQVFPGPGRGPRDWRRPQAIGGEGRRLTPWTRTAAWPRSW
jgi:hypothetical protein